MVGEKEEGLVTLVWKKVILEAEQVIGLFMNIFLLPHFYDESFTIRPAMRIKKVNSD